MKLIGTLLLSCSITLATAQTANSFNKARDEAKAQATKMGNDLVKKNYKSFVSKTYPKAIDEANGGLAKMEQDIITQVASMERENTFIMSASTGETTRIVDTAGEWQCTIPQILEMKIPEGRITTTTTLICLSPDKGRTWYFMDVADRDLATMRNIFPNISSKHRLKKSPEPVFIKD